MVAPSIEDGYALVVNEALTSGLPVITTPNTGAADHIRHAINGYLVPIASSEAIAERVETLYRDRDLLQRLSEGARDTIADIGSWKDRVRAFADVYDRIASEGSLGCYLPSGNAFPRH